MKAVLTLTPAESRRLIAKAVVAMPEVQKAWSDAYLLLAGGTTNARKCFLTRKLADDYRIHRVIQLLKEGTDQDRKEKQKNLFPDDSCQHRVF